MNRLKRLVTEIHRRSIWQVLGIYLVGAGAGYQVIQSLTEGLGLPSWFPAFSIILFIILLPVVVATAFVRESVSASVSHEAPPETAVEATAADAEAVASVSESRRHVLTWHNAVLAVVVALAIWGVIAAGWLLFEGGARPSDTKLPPGRKMLAVMPFENLGHPDDEYFADGITEEITSHLAQLSGLGVISRTSAIQYKDTEKPIEQIGQELGVEYVLEGTVRWEKPPEGQSRVRVTPQLIRVSDATHLWAEGYDAVLAGVFEIQSDIAEKVAQALEVTLLEPERQALEAKPTENLEAYDYFLRGNEYLDRPWSEENTQIAIRMYDQAVGLDPNFARAYARLSWCHSRMYWFYYDRSEERLAKAKEAASQSLRISPNLAEAYLAMGYYYYYGYRNYERALDQIGIALKREPNNSEIYSAIGFVRRRQGDWEQALQDMLKARELDPRNSNLAVQIGLTYFWMHRYSEAKRSFDQAVSLAPDELLSYILLARLQVSWQGSTEEARGVLRKATRTIRPGMLLDRSVSGSWALLRTLYDDPEETLAELSASSADADPALLHLALAELHSRTDRPTESVAHYDSARTILEAQVEERPDDAIFLSELGVAYAGLGLKSKARSAGMRAVEMLPPARDAMDATVPPAYLAQIFVMVGEESRAIDQLETLLADPGWLSAPWLRLDPIWDPLRGHPRWQPLLQATE